MYRYLEAIHSFLGGFLTPTTRHRMCEEKAIRDNLNEDHIDHMVEDSFPASDPPATY